MSVVRTVERRPTGVTLAEPRLGCESSMPSLRKNIRLPLAVLVACIALLAAVAAPASAAGPDSTASASAACAPARLHVSSGCVGRRGARRHIEAMVREAMPELGLRATIMRVDT